MEIQISSFSSGLMLGNTLYRNQPGISNKILAQIGYGLIAIAASVECVASLIFFVLTVPPCLVIKFDDARNYHIFSMGVCDSIGASGFTFVWAIADFALNFFCQKLVADEKSAIKVFKSGFLLTLPEGALV